MSKRKKTNKISEAQVTDEMQVTDEVQVTDEQQATSEAQATDELQATGEPGETGKKKDKRAERKLKRPRRKAHIRWEKLDNTANVFPVTAGESMTNVYRISVTLREQIQPEILQEALDIVLPKMDGFNLRLRTGVFWYYFEENGKRAPKVVEESTFPCRFIQMNKNRNYMFRVSYYENRINLEVFHVLTDGMGGLNFLKEITYQYLRLVHSEIREQVGDTLSQSTSLNREDSFVKNYKKSKPSGFEKERAYLIKGEKLPSGEFGVVHGILPIAQLKEVAHRYEVSINEYLVANFVWSTYVERMKRMPHKRTIRVAVPVNLRPYFNSVTTKNFFVMVSANFHADREDYTFAEVVAIVRDSLRKQIDKENLENLFSYSVSNQMNKWLRIFPLFLKNLAISTVYTKNALANTTTITNIGNVSIDEHYRQYIEQFYAFIPMSKGQSVKGTICSYDDKLVFTFSSTFSDNSIQRCFFSQIASEGVDVAVRTNGVYYD